MPISRHKSIPLLIRHGSATENEIVIRKALCRNAKQSERITDYELVLASGCAYKAIVYKAICAIGRNELLSLQCGENAPMSKHQSLVEYILLNDCHDFNATFTRPAPIACLQYASNVVSLEFAPMSLFVSDAHNKNVWSFEAIGKVMQDLESCLNVSDLQMWYENENGVTFKPF